MTTFKYKGPKYHFNKGKKKASGGNGTVFLIDYECSDQRYPSNIKLVAKFFNCKKIKKSEEEKRRLSRFINETKFVFNYQSKLKNIIPIFDYCIDVKNNNYWYIMPLANEFNVKEMIGLEKKLKNMLDIANSIKSLHDLPDEKRAHRDIKPDNMLWYNNHLCLTDFGLLWCAKETRLSRDNEKIGPKFILPPELLKVDIMDEKMDFRKSDVYLFAKVLWMYLKNDDIGFQGEYRLANDKIALSKKKFSEVSFKTICPLNELLIKSTKDNYYERIDIDEAIQLINEELDIINDNELYKKYIFREKQLDIWSSEKEDIKVFKNCDIIFDTISSILKDEKVILEINENSKSDEYKMINSLSKFGNGIIKISVKNAINIHCKIDSLEVERDKECLVLKLTNIDDDRLPIYIVDTFIMPNDYRLSSNQTIIIKKEL